MRGRPYLVIENNGDVRWIPPMVLKTVCEHDHQVGEVTNKFCTADTLVLYSSRKSLVT